MFLDKIVLILFTVLLVQGEETLSSSTAFGTRTFLPEIVPLKVQRSLLETGDLYVTIQVLYSKDSVISWVAHGKQSSIIDSIDLPIDDVAPSQYTLQLSIPREVADKRHISTGMNTGLFRLEEEDFLVDYEELYVKFQAITLPEASVLKVSLRTNNTEDKNQDTTSKVHENNSLNDFEEVEPRFPEMEELETSQIIIYPGTHTTVSLNVLVTENDRFSVRGLLYNSSSNKILTTFWTTDYTLGPFDFQKITTSDNDNEDNDIVEDNVKMIDNFDSQDLAGLRQILIEIPTEKGDISGVYTIRAHHEAGPEVGYIIESCLEQIFLVQKENQEHGPIPQGVLKFEAGGYSQLSCQIGLQCLVSCHVFGVGVQSLQLMHKNLDRDFVLLQNDTVEYGPYESVIFALVDSTNPAWSGTYICRAVSGLVSITKEIDVNFWE